MNMDLVEKIANWQPIETAPKDGTWFLMTDGKRMLVAHWHKYNNTPEFMAMHPNAIQGRWLSPQDHTELDIAAADLDEPTHWMPLPEPPTS
jgi:hypothetical protein